MNFINKHIKYFFVAILFCLASNTYAQRLSATVDAPVIKLGEQLVLKLKLDGTSPNAVNQLWNVPDSLGAFEVVEAKKADSSQSEIVQEFVMTSFNTGNHKIPPFKVVLHNGMQFTTDSIAVQVREVDVSQLKDYHDIKDVIAIQEPEPTWKLLIIVLSIVFVVMAVLYFLFYRKKKKPEVKTISLNLLDNTLSKINEIHQQQYFQKNQHKKFYSELIDTVHVFSDELASQNTKQLTTSEWMIRLNSFSINKDIESQFFQTLRISDAVKFAKYIPDNNKEKESVDATVSFVKALWQLRYSKSI